MIRGTEGYTLIELIVVIVLIGIMMTLTMPRFRYAMLTDEMKSTTRRMVGMMRNLRNEAIREQKNHHLHFNFESNRYWIETPDMTDEERAIAREKAFSFPTGIRVLDVAFRGEEKKVLGETDIRFNKKGYVQPSLIHLGSEDGREFTLVLSPFMGRIKVLEKYVDSNDY